MLHEFEEQIITKFEKELGKYEWIAGPKMSIIDIIVYCELHQVIAMYERPIPHQLAKLNEWYEKMSELDCVKEVAAHVDPVLVEFKLKESF